MKNLNLIIRKAARRWAERRKAECKAEDHTETMHTAEIHADADHVASGELEEIQSATAAQLSEQPAAVPFSEPSDNLTDNKNNSVGRMNQTEQQLADFLTTHYQFRCNVFSDVTEYASVASSTGFKDENKKMKETGAFRPVTVRALNSFCLAAHREGISCCDRDMSWLVNSRIKIRNIYEQKRRETTWISHLFLIDIYRLLTDNYLTSSKSIVSLCKQLAWTCCKYSAKPKISIHKQPHSQLVQKYKNKIEIKEYNSQQITLLLFIF